MCTTLVEPAVDWLDACVVNYRSVLSVLAVDTVPRRRIFC